MKTTYKQKGEGAAKKIREEIAEGIFRAVRKKARHMRPEELIEHGVTLDWDHFRQSGCAISIDTVINYSRVSESDVLVIGSVYRGEEDPEARTINIDPAQRGEDDSARLKPRQTVTFYLMNDERYPERLEFLLGSEMPNYTFQ